jgi:flagellar biosynthesis activator protein FlaF
LPASFYADVTEDSGTVGREREREAFDRGIAMMRSAADGATNQEAARYMQELWGFLIRDLASPNNDLSDDLKANLISIGLWVLRETDAIITGAKAGWDALIDINTTVREGLA